MNDKIPGPNPMLFDYIEQKFPDRILTSIYQHEKGRLVYHKNFYEKEGYLEELQEEAVWFGTRKFYSQIAILVAFNFWAIAFFTSPFYNSVEWVKFISFAAIVIVLVVDTTVWMNRKNQRTNCIMEYTIPISAIVTDLQRMGTYEACVTVCAQYDKEITKINTKIDKHNAKHEQIQDYQALLKMLRHENKHLHDKFLTDLRSQNSAGEVFDMTIEPNTKDNIN